MDTDRRPVTIVFTDIVGSTMLAEQIDPEEWKEIVNGAHRRVSDAVLRYEGTIAQLLGDGVLAFFGAPHAHEDDPARAVRAGVEIQRAISEYTRELRGYVDEFEMRVGINSGEVVVGAVGGAEHAEYLAVGDAVNLAARLQSAARPGTVLISETTARAVKHLFDLKDLGEIQVKGKAEPVRVFEVVDLRAGFASGRGIEGLTSPLVGRERELKELRQMLDALRAGQGQIAFVLGEAGIGKSRLVEEARIAHSKSPIAQTDPLLAISDTRFAIRFLEGRALSYGQTLSFWTITQLIQNDLELADGAPEVKTKFALRRRVKELFADKSDEVLPYLAHLLGVKLDGELAERVQVLDGETLKRQVLISIAEYFAKLAQQQPTVLVFEDLHWADPSTLDALERLLRVTERAPLMIIALMRAESDKPAWRIRDLAARDYRRRFRELELEPLSSTDADELVNNLLAISNLPDALRGLILERAEGNPFYLEEIIRSLIEQGAIERDEDHWRATQAIANVTIPPTLQALLLARIDRLEDDVKRTLQLASVIGRSFLYKLLEAISDAERELDWHLAQLEHADLVREKERFPELEYMFKHSLTQEAAYESLLHERRKEFHRRVGEALEKFSAARQQEFLGLLAHHFDRAGEKEKALDYLIRAGDKTRFEDSHEEAIQFYQRAIEVLHERGDSVGEAKTWLKLGLIYHANFDFEKAHAANEAAFALQQRARTQRATTAQARKEKPQLLRSGTRLENLEKLTLDPAKVTQTPNVETVANLFAGLADLDSETNLVPHVAKSWEVLDGGTRYVFHLRDDVYWSDGTRVTAADFEWAWKRNLHPGTDAYYALWFDDIVGARDFREGRTNDSDMVGVHALDEFTLEVQLNAPSAYFIYLMWLPVMYPLPRAHIERFGDDWWKPDHTMSNGAFRLVEFDASRITVERNADYFGEFPGNIHRFELELKETTEDIVQAYLENSLDAAWGIPTSHIPPPIPSGEVRRLSILGVFGFLLSPTRPPFDDVRVRRAFAHGFDRAQMLAILERGNSPARGGIVPPGMPGHSPDIGLRFDPDLARELLRQAGYPNGELLPALMMLYGSDYRKPTENIAQQLHENLGLQVDIREQQPGIRWLDQDSAHIVPFGWTADYPDPDTFLRQSWFYQQLRRWGWDDLRYKDLVQEAVSIPDRARRMAMYREADRILVADQVLVIPTNYAQGGYVDLLKPWITGYKLNAFGYARTKDLRIEPR